MHPRRSGSNNKDTNPFRKTFRQKQMLRKTRFGKLSKMLRKTRGEGHRPPKRNEMKQPKQNSETDQKQKGGRGRTGRRNETERSTRNPSHERETKMLCQFLICLIIVVNVCQKKCLFVFFFLIISFPFFFLFSFFNHY